MLIKGWRQIGWDEAKHCHRKGETQPWTTECRTISCNLIKTQQRFLLPALSSCDRKYALIWPGEQRTRHHRCLWPYLPELCHWYDISLYPLTLLWDYSHAFTSFCPNDGATGNLQGISDVSLFAYFGVWMTHRCEKLRRGLHRMQCDPRGQLQPSNA